MSKTTTVILGGTSAVAMAYARLAILEGEQVILVARNKKKLSANTADLNARGDGDSSFILADLAKSDEIEAVWSKILEAANKIDKVLIAYGTLGDQMNSQNNLKNLQEILSTNFLSVALWCEKAFSYFKTEGTGKLTVIGSVAGDRGRQSNYHYGAAKGGLDTLIQGMAHRAAKLVEARINVLLVKPGFIDTPMTDHIDKSGPLWASPEKVARIIRKAEKKNKHSVYAPWFWRYILLIIRLLPFFIFKRTNL